MDEKSESPFLMPYSTRPAVWWELWRKRKRSCCPHCGGYCGEVGPTCDEFNDWRAGQ